MVESAVAVPDVEQQAQAPNGVASPSLKRRQSSEPVEPDTSKRPRLDISNTNGTNGANGSHHTSPPPSATATSPPRRKSTLPTAGTDEKSRNKRLFGGLLSTLSASSKKPSSTIKRRDEIEQRQRERIKRDDEEIVEARRKKREELDRKRKVEQKRWDEQSMRVRHANMRATAGFLRTQTEPRIHWKPWEMSKEEEERVRRQKEEVEETIRKELNDRGARTEPGVTNGKSEAEDEDHTTHSRNDEEVDKPHVDAAQNDARPGSEHPADARADPADCDSKDENVQESAAADAAKAPPETEGTALDDKTVDDHDGGDDIIEGHDEDQVIY